MEDIKNPLRILMIFDVIFLVLGLQTLTNPLEEYPTLLCAYNNESSMDPQENLEIASITPENVRSSKFRNEYFSIINLIKKAESSSSTEQFLQSCIQSQLIPKTFQERRKPEGLNDTENEIWQRQVTETDICYVTLAYEKTKRKSCEICEKLQNVTENFKAHLSNQHEENAFVIHFQSVRNKSKKEKTKQRENKLQRLMGETLDSLEKSDSLSESVTDLDDSEDTFEENPIVEATQ